MKTKFDIWREDGFDYIADIGIMKKAIVVAKYMNMKYKISNRSYFPFPDEYYYIEHPTAEAAISLAENYISEWFKSLMKVNNDQLSSDQLLISTTEQINEN